MYGRLEISCIVPCVPLCFQSWILATQFRSLIFSQIEQLKRRKKRNRTHEKISHEHTLLIGINIWGKGQLKATFNAPFPWQESPNQSNVSFSYISWYLPNYPSSIIHRMMQTLLLSTPMAIRQHIYKFTSTYTFKDDATLLLSSTKWKHCYCNGLSLHPTTHFSTA